MTSEPIAAAAPPPQGPDLLDLAWRYGGSSAATAALLALAAATLAAAAIYPQQPAGMDGNTAEHWLTATAAGYGSVGLALRALGAFTILGGTWLKVIGALLGYHLLLRLAGHARHAWRALRDQSAPLPPARLPGARALLPISAEAACELATRVLGGEAGPSGMRPSGTAPGLQGSEARWADAPGSGHAGGIRADTETAVRPGRVPAAWQATPAGDRASAPAARQAGRAAAAVAALTPDDERERPQAAREDKAGAARLSVRDSAREASGPRAQDAAAAPQVGAQAAARASEGADRPDEQAASPGAAPARPAARRSRGYRVAEAAGTGEWRVLYGQRKAWGTLGPVLAYLGCLLVLIALLLDDTAGWTLDRLALTQGMTAAAPGAAAAGSWLGDGGVEVRLHEVTGPERNPFSTVSLQRPGGSPAKVTVGYAAPAIWGNLWLVQRETGAALSVAAQDDAGHEVVLQPPAAGGRVGGSVRVLFTATQTEQVFAAPARNLAFRVVVYPALPERAITQTVFLLEAYRGTDTTPALSQLVRGQAQVTLDNVTYTFQEDRHAVFSMSYVPGAAPLTLGALLLLAGVAVALWWRRAEAWISLAAEEGGTVVTVRARALLDGEQERERLARLLMRACEEQP